MKRLAVSLLAILSLSLTGSVIAQENDAFIAPLAEESLLLDITTTSDNRLIAVGERGHILISDNGDEWHQQSVPSQATLTTVFAKEGQVWAAGHDAVILHSADNGKTWSLVHQDIPLQKPIMDLHFFNPEHGIAIGAYGLFYRTQDGGQSWAKEQHIELLSEMDREYLQDLKENDPEFYEIEVSAIMPHLNRVAEGPDGTLYMAAEMGTLAKSDDNGKAWQRLDIDYFGSFFAIDVSTNGRVVAAGLRGNVFELTDDAEWDKIVSETDSTINSVVPLNNNELLLVGNKGVKLHLSDEVKLSQWKEEKAILNAVSYQNKIIAVTEVGIQVFQQ